MADPTNVLTIDDVAMMTGRRVKVAAASVEDLNLLLTRLARMDDSIEDIVDEESEAEAEPDTLAEEADRDAPVIKLVHSIVAQAVQQGASDIHVNPEEGDTRVLFRVDGVLAPAATVKRRMAMGVVSRIKIMGDLDISEKRVPQDGRFALTVDGRRVDIRVVTLPLVYGEGVVMRILDGGVGSRARLAGDAAGRAGPVHARDQQAERRCARDRTDRLGQVDDAVRGAERAQRRRTEHPHDRGPRGAAHAGVKQMQIAPKAGVTFDVGLRSMLRADPDVIMVGEIRDRETAHIAVEAALTGHLVLSTLHTRDAPSALGRLIDMGIEPFLVSSAIDCIVAQRLVRPLCTHCKRPLRSQRLVLAEHGLAGAEPYRGGRLLALWRLGLSRPAGAVRGDVRERADPGADPRARLGRRDGRDRRRRRDAAPA